MIAFFQQLRLFAVNGDNDGGGWIQLLVFVVLGVVYALGNLAKAKAGKSEESQKDAAKPGPRYKPLDEFETSKKTSTQRQQQPKPQRYTPPKRPAKQVPPQRYPARTLRQALAAGAAVKPGKIEKLAMHDLKLISDGLTGKKAMLKDEKLEPVVSEPAKAETSGDVLFELTAHEQLQAAILHYEILGRPLALREREY